VSKQSFKIKGVRQDELNYDLASYVLWRMAKRRVLERRKREAEDKAKRRGVKS
jgi:hypothetical protein